MLAVTSLNTEEYLWYSGGTVERSGGAGEGVSDVSEERRWIRNCLEPGRLAARKNAAAPIRLIEGGAEPSGDGGGGGSCGGGTGAGKVTVPRAQSTNGLWRVRKSNPSTAVAGGARFVT